MHRARRATKNEAAEKGQMACFGLHGYSWRSGGAADMRFGIGSESIAE